MSEYTFSDFHHTYLGGRYPEHSLNVGYHGSQVCSEFTDCWDFLLDTFKDQSDLSFLEIGAFRGLWGLRLLYELGRGSFDNVSYDTVTLLSHDIQNQSLNIIKSLYDSNTDRATMNIIDNDSTDKSNLSKLNESYDVVFIDANHSYEYVYKDIEIYAPLAKTILMFHDIRPKEPNPNCGVYAAIKDHNLSLDLEISYLDNIMGIGIVKVQRIHKIK